MKACELPCEVQEEARRVTRIILDEAIALHTKYGPFMLERFYQELLRARLVKRGLKAEKKVPIAVEEEGVAIDIAFRADLVVNDSIIIEVKANKEQQSVWNQQVLTHMNLVRLHYGVLINFGLPRIRDGYVRFAL